MLNGTSSNPKDKIGHFFLCGGMIGQKYVRHQALVSRHVVYVVAEFVHK